MKKNNSIELYIHIPFCERKCNYCDFISFYTDTNTQIEYIKKLLSEINNKSFFAKNKYIRSIYIGGGTPSILSIYHIINIMDCIYKYYKTNKHTEITIEGNPNSLSYDKLLNYNRIGINRLSIGLQTTNEKELLELGRLHTYNDFLVQYKNAIKAGFSNINVDLINGIPFQTALSYKKSLENVLSLDIKHISIYNLIIEKNTVFYKKFNENKLSLPNEDELKKIDEVTYNLTNKYRLKRYEISNYAKNGFESKHNLGYWSDIPYIGFGLNASSYHNGIRTKNKSKLIEYLNLDYNIYEKYYNNSERNLDFYDEYTKLDLNEYKKEYIMLSLRKRIGINLSIYKEKFNENFYKTYYNKISNYLKLGFMRIKNGNISLTNSGMDISNYILSDLI